MGTILCVFTIAYAVSWLVVNLVLLWYLYSETLINGKLVCSYGKESVICKRDFPSTHRVHVWYWCGSYTVQYTTVVLYLQRRLLSSLFLKHNHDLFDIAYLIVSNLVYFKADYSWSRAGQYFQCIGDIVIKACNKNCIEDISQVMIYQVHDMLWYIAYNYRILST